MTAEHESQFTHGRPEEADVAASLLYEADPPYYDYWFGGRDAAIIGLARLWKADVGSYSHRQVSVMRDGERMAGLALSYPASWEGDLDLADKKVMLKAFGDEAPAAIQREIELGRLFPRLPEHIWHLRILAIAPERRGQGVGAAILAEMEADARRNGYAQILVDVDSGNPGAVRFYQRAGYEIIVETIVRALIPHRLGASFRMGKALNQ